MDIKEYIAGGTTGENHPWEIARFNIVYDIIKKYISEETKTIADVGCGDVFFLENLSRKLENKKLLAIDTAFTNEIITLLKERHHQSEIHFFQNIFEAADKKEKADLIFLMDVIEHIEDDRGFLNELIASDFVNDKCFLVITVPAYQYLFSSHDVWLGHYRRYNLKLLQDTVDNKNIEILEKGYFFKTLVVFRLLQKIFERKNSNKGTDVSNWKGGKIKTYLYKSILWLDYIVFNKLFRLKKFPGLSCFLIAKIEK